jgi:2-iminobutanoate/2-iminopropanoate deaminase
VPDLRFIEPESFGPPTMPFSQGVRAGNLLFVAGQVGGGDGIAEQTRAALERVRTVLAEEGADLTNIVSATVYLTDVADFAAYNEVWVEAFGDHRPARATVRADLMAPGLVVEIQAIAVLD